MYTPIQQDAIDNKIHEFMARKSPSRTFSKSIAERFSPLCVLDANRVQRLRMSSSNGIKVVSRDVPSGKKLTNNTHP